MDISSFILLVYLFTSLHSTLFLFLIILLSTGKYIPFVSLGTPWAIDVVEIRQTL